ncbi:MAG: hypothetical protein J6Y71_07555 [Ruminococcus sp.]|nr:hypothetical protein [Ruminococcus sp.]
MAADGYLNFDTRINTQGFETDTKRIGKALTNFKSQLQGLGKTILAVFSVRTIAAFGTKLIETSAQVKALNAQFEQTFGSLQTAAEEAMQRVADASGIMVDRLKGAGTQIYAFAKANGMESVQALNMMEDALQVAADSAAYYDRSLEETTQTLRSFLKGAYMNDAALGVSATETTRNAQAMKLYGKSFKDLTEAQKQLTLLQMVKDANDLSGATGQAAREAEGWENVLGNLKETWKQLIAVVGQPALHIAVDVVKELTAALSVLLEKARAAVSVLNELFGWEDVSTASIASNISESVDYQEDLTTAVEETTENQKKSLEIEENSLANFDQINTVTTKTASETEPETSAEKPTEVIPVKVVPSVADKEVNEAVDTLSDKLSSLLEPVRLAWEDNSPELIANATRAAETIKGLFDSIGESIAEVWTNGSGERFVGNIITLFSDVLGIIGDISLALKNAWDDGDRGTTLVQSYVDRWNSILELIHEVSKSFRDAWNDGTGEKIFGKILDIITNINNIWVNLRKRFTEAWTENERGTRIFSAILSIIDSILGTVKKITSSTAEWAKKIDFAPLLDSIAGLLEEIEPLSDNIGDGLAWFYENVLLPLGKWTLEKAVPTFLNLLGSAIKFVNSVLTVLKPAAQYFIDKFLKPIASWTGGVIITVLGTLTEALSNVADWITKHQDLLSGMMTIIQGVTGAIVGFFTQGIVLGDEFAQVGEKIYNVFDTVKEIVLSVLGTIGETVRNYINSAEEILSEIGKYIENTFSTVFVFLSDIWKNIKKVFSEVGGWFKSQFSKAWDNIKAAWSTVVKWFTDIWTNIKKVFSVASKWFGEQFQAAWDNIESIFKGMGTWFSERWNDVVNVFTVVGTWFGDRFCEAWNNITNIFNGIYGYFSDRLNDIHNIFGSIGDWFEDKFRNAWDRVKNVFSGVRGFFDDLWSSVSNGARDGINWVIEKLNSLIWRLQDGLNSIVNSLNSALSIHIPDNVPVIGGTSFEMGLPNVRIPSIPYLAQGTYVPANYGNFLAVLGDNKREPEIVSPVSSIKTAVREVIKEQGGSDKPITVVCVLDGREIGRVAVNAVNRDKALKGG